MTLCVFVGPTLRREEVAGVGDVVWLPPVAQGDVYRVAQQRPDAIGIVDGFFSGAPSVWHKEILWALLQGIPMFGSASMGALRAAELHGFGMRGVGKVFEAFRDGVLEDDDEVAVVHGPAETGFVPASEAMVNIRATLAAAEAQGVLGAASREAIEGLAKSTFFPHRSWPMLLDGARARGVAAGELVALRAWLPAGRIDQKRADALAMLEAMQAREAGDAARPRFRFEWTNFWDAMFARGRIPAAPPAAADADDAVVEELRLQGDEVIGAVRSRALLRLLAEAEAERRGLEPSLEARRATLGNLRAALGLFTRADLDAWLARSGLDIAAFERLVAARSRLEAVAGALRPELDRCLLDELRLSAGYEGLAARARDKREVLAAADGEADSPHAAAGLRLWFFEQRLGRPVPDDVAAYARELGFDNLADFDSALRRERLYLEKMPRKADRSSA